MKTRQEAATRNSRNKIILIFAILLSTVLFSTGRQDALAGSSASASDPSPDAPSATCPDAQCFSDVPTDNPFFAFANRLYQQDIISGYACGGPGEPCDAQNRPYYRPGNTVNRQQMAKFVDQARRLPGIHIEGSSADPAIYVSNTFASSIAIQGISEGSSGTGILGSGQANGVVGLGQVNGVYGQGASSGVAGLSTNGDGVFGVSAGTNKSGVYGENTSGGYGVRGRSSTTYAAVLGDSSGNEGTGVAGIANTGFSANGVLGLSTQGYGVRGESTSGLAGVYGLNSGQLDGVRGESTGASGIGVHGRAYNGSNATGVWGQSSGNGVVGEGTYGVVGYSNSLNMAGVYGQNSGQGYGVRGHTTTTYAAVLGDSTGTDGAGVAGVANSGANAKGVYGVSSGGWAGYFDQNIYVGGNCIGCLGSNRIDHPLDPENKYLYHAAVESPDMKNIYDGNVTTDAKGEAVITLPDYFEALNEDFRYQLTVIGAFAQAIVFQEINHNKFVIKTDKPYVKVSWQVTGIRQDPYSEQHQVQVEVEKTEEERGKYQHPQEWGQPETKGIDYELRQQLEQANSPALNQKP